jgi:hypothetical protein
MLYLHLLYTDIEIILLSLSVCKEFIVLVISRNIMHRYKLTDIDIIGMDVALLYTKVEELYS